MAVQFKKIDARTPNGWIPKDELWEFLSSGQAGELSELALFTDADDNGYVDFVEFCAFLAKNHDESIVVV
jgi:Ca2+-binding EF-hand superfamily protein